MAWQQELEEGRALEAAREQQPPPPLPPRTYTTPMFDEHGVLVGALPEDGVQRVRYIIERRLS